VSVDRLALQTSHTHQWILFMTQTDDDTPKTNCSKHFDTLFGDVRDRALAHAKFRADRPEISINQSINLYFAQICKICPRAKNTYFSLQGTPLELSSHAVYFRRLPSSRCCAPFDM